MAARGAVDQVVVLEAVGQDGVVAQGVVGLHLLGFLAREDARVHAAFELFGHGVAPGLALGHRLDELVVERFDPDL